MQIFSKIIKASTFFVLIFSLQNQSIQAQKKSIKMTNPLLQKSTLQYQAPPFNLIKDEHFKPAFDYGLKIHDQEVAKIANKETSTAKFNNVMIKIWVRLHSETNY